jgi:ribose transport system substrate-binding protein
MNRARLPQLPQLLLLCFAALPALPAAAAGPPSIAIVAKGYSQPFWQNVMRGALQAARELGVTISFSGPDDASPAGSADMVDQQIALAGEALARKPSVLCVDALDSRKLVPLLQKARAAGVPVIGFDSGVDSPVAVCTAATDNAAAAALAANKLAALLGGSGTVGFISANPADPAALDRQRGFAGEMKRRYPGIQLVGSQYSGGDPRTSAESVKAMLQSTPEIAGFFGSDEGSAAGILNAVQDLGLAGRIVIVGFDSGQAQVDAIRGGLEAGAVVQDPVRIGYKTVEAAVDVLHGRRVPRRIDTGFHWYDRANIDDPAMAILLHP